MHYIVYKLVPLSCPPLQAKLLDPPVRMYSECFVLLLNVG